MHEGKLILSIDPGNEKTGYALMRGKNVGKFGVEENWDMLSFISENSDTIDILAYEMIASYGMPVGKDIFQTCLWIGRFIQEFEKESVPIYRKDVKLHLCGTFRAKDSNIRQAIIDKYSPEGGGKTPQVGTKSKPGPLYGVNSHIWPAIGVGLTLQCL